MSHLTDHDTSSAMVRERYRLLTRQIPTLYMIVIVCTFPVIGLILTRGGGVVMAIPPAVVVVLVFARMMHWRRARGRFDTMTLAQMQREMRRTAVIGPALGFVLAGVAIAGGLRLDSQAQAITLVTVWMCTIACSFCLSTLPRTAYAIVFASGAPLSSVFLYQGEPLLVIATGLIVALACMVVYVVKQTHDAFGEIVRARSLADERHDIAARGAQEAAHLANSDWLTLLPNRRRFMAEIAERTRRPGRAFAVALIDLDGFKPINDIHGHAAGDAVLVEIGHRLGRLAAGRCFAARFGGDEFCLMIEPAETVEEALSIARLARAAIGERIDLSPDLRVRVDCCVGVALHDGLASPSDLMGRADATLYRCKKRGRGAVEAWSYEDEAPAAIERAA